MKIHNQTFRILLIGIIIPLIFSCKSKELSREVAEKLIIQKNNFPIDNIMEINLIFETSVKLTSTSKETDYLPPKEGLLLKLEQSGLLIYTIKRTSSIVTGETWWAPNGGGGYSSPLDYFTGKDAGRIHKWDITETYKHIGTLTEKGKPYLVNGNNFKVSKIEFGGITGIVKNEGFNITEVEYTVTETPTPFGETAFNKLAQSNKRSATFRKYDDGWRIESN